MTASAETWDFKFVDWSRLETESASKDVPSLGRVVRAWHDRETDAAKKAVLGFLADVLMLRTPWGRDAGLSLVPEQIFISLPRPGAAALAAELPRMASADLRAHVADFAWTKRRACSHSEVRAGIEAYLEGARRGLNSAQWPDSFARLQRALVLAATLGRQDALFERALDEVEGSIAAVSDGERNNSSYFPGRLMDLLLEHRRGDARHYAEVARRFAEEATATDHDRAIYYLEVATRWHQRDNDVVATQSCRKRIIEILQLEAAEAEPAIACHLLTQAIEVARELPNNQAQAEALRVELQGRQRANVAEFVNYESTIDLSDCAADARARVGGKPPLHALIALCALRQPTPPQQVRERVQALHKDSIFRQLIPQVMVSAAGRVLGRNNGLMGDEDALLWEMHRDVAVHQQIFARGGIAPAIELLQLEHGFRLEDFFYFSRRSPFVPPGRELTFARGLLAGFYGDFSVAAHLLIPQIENGIRLVLEQVGAVTTTLTSTGLQNEKDLGSLLAEPKAVEIFGEAQVFDMRSLLTEKAGANLRNELAHGLTSDEAADDHCAYAWWVALRLLLAPLVGGGMPSSQDAPSAEKSGGGGPADDPAIPADGTATSIEQPTSESHRHGST